MAVFLYFVWSICLIYWSFWGRSIMSQWLCICVNMFGSKDIVKNKNSKSLILSDIILPQKILQYYTAYIFFSSFVTVKLLLFHPRPRWHRHTDHWNTVTVLISITTTWGLGFIWFLLWERKSIIRLLELELRHPSHLDSLLSMLRYCWGVMWLKCRLIVAAMDYTAPESF